MRRPLRSPSRALLIALYANAAGLLLIGLTLMNRSSTRFPELSSSAMAQSQLPIGGGAGVFVVPAQFNSNLFGCYLMDVDAQTLCAYQYTPDKQLRLIAARTFKYDRRVNVYNTSPPPSDIRDLIEKEAAELRTTDQNRPPIEPEKKQEK